MLSSPTVGTSPSVVLTKGNISEASEALAVLGYDKNTILAVIKDANPEWSVEEIIKFALKKLTR